MEVKDLFCDEFQATLNKANTTLQSLIILANTMLQNGDNITAITDRLHQELKPVGDELGVTFKMHIFAFPSFITKSKERLETDGEDFTVC